MGKSKAKKLREKQQREGKRNPEMRRGTYSLVDLTSKMTKTKKEKLKQIKHKKRLFDREDTGSSERSFLCLLFLKCG